MGLHEEVIIAAAALNIGGMLALEMSQVEEAVKLFQQANQFDSGICVAAK